MKKNKDQKPKSVAARIAPLLYTSAGLTLCTMLALAPSIIKRPAALGD